MWLFFVPFPGLHSSYLLVFRHPMPQLAAGRGLCPRTIPLPAVSEQQSPAILWFWGKGKGPASGMNVFKGCREPRSKWGSPVGGNFWGGSDFGCLNLLLVATVTWVWRCRIVPSWDGCQPPVGFGMGFQ